MVDTINPQTGTPDDFTQRVTPTEPNLNQNPQNFYAGFGKPDDVKVNLANSAPSTDQVPTPNIPPVTNMQIPNTSDVRPTGVPQPREENPNTMVNPIAQPTEIYQSNESNSNGAQSILIMSGIIVVTLVMASVVSYFSINSYYKGRLKKEESKLSALNGDYDKENTAPAPLEPEVKEVPAATAPTPTPSPTPSPSQNNVTKPITTPTPTPTPVIETPKPQNPGTSGQGMG